MSRNPILSMGTAEVRLETDEMATAGDLGFAPGTYVIVDPEGNEVDNGRWIQVGKKIGAEELESAKVLTQSRSRQILRPCPKPGPISSAGTVSRSPRSGWPF